MGKQSLFRRVATAFREEGEESSENIDREMESAVKAIKEAEVSSLTTEEVVETLRLAGAFDGERDDANDGPLGGVRMSGAMGERRAGRARRWMMDRRLLTKRRIEDFPFGGPDQRMGERRSNTNRRNYDRRAA